MKENVTFQEGTCPETIQPDQIQDGRLSAIIDMHNIWQTGVVNYSLFHQILGVAFFLLLLGHCFLTKLFSDHFFISPQLSWTFGGILLL